MKRAMMLSVALLAVFSLKGFALTGDSIACEVKFFGELDAGGHDIPVDKLKETDPSALSRFADAGPVFSTDVYMGAVRVPFEHPKYKFTLGTAFISTRIGSVDGSGHLVLGYAHAVEVDGDGKPIRAAQNTCLTGMLSKNNGSTTISDCQYPAYPRPGEEEENPFDLKNGWKLVELDANGEPKLELNERIYLETVSGNGILAGRCTNVRVIGPNPPPRPLP